jgi:hypothetical protein
VFSAPLFFRVALLFVRKTGSPLEAKDAAPIAADRSMSRASTNLNLQEFRLAKLSADRLNSCEFSYFEKPTRHDR